jgi:vitamin B12 transporter
MHSRSASVRRAAAAFLLVSSVTAPALAAAPDSLVVVGADTLFVAAPVEVVGAAVPVALPGALRPVGVRDGDDAAALPVPAVADLLGREPAVVTGSRQAWGVQTDLSVRGSTFEQVQILLDGVDLGDPQTGHHLMNLPLSLQDVARVEVLPGHGSVLYGSGAFGGTVNVVPRRPARRTGGEVGLLGGGDGTWAVRGVMDVALDGDETSAALDPRAPMGDRGRGLRLSAERFRTDGHEVDGQWSGRDADLATATARYLGAGDQGLLDVFAGWADRRFGAQDFYAPVRSYEETSSLVLSARGRTRVGGVVLEPWVAGRRHRDVFTLFRDDPDRYRNDHLTRRAMAGLRAMQPVAADWVLSGLVEGAYEDIDSQGVRGGATGPALGVHQRRRASAATELSRTLAPVRLQAGARLDLRDGEAPRWNGSAAVAWEPRPAWAVHASAGTVFRLPTFTELYYEDPFNRGNPDLRPETGWAWDAGVRRDDGTWLLGVTWFERHENDLIDWARPATVDTVWQVLNVAEATTRGIEARAAWRHGRGHRVEAGYQFLDRTTELAPGVEAKYDLVAPRHHLTAAATAALPHDLGVTLTVRHLERTGGDDAFGEYVVWDLRLAWRPDRWAVTMDILNLADRRYAETPGAIMPGRTLLGGVTRTF